MFSNKLDSHKHLNNGYIYKFVMILQDSCGSSPVFYRPAIINAPDTMARQALIIPRPAKLKCRSGINPVIMSQTPNNRNPMFLVIFIF
jgi:hypothetical protein